MQLTVRDTAQHLGVDQATIDALERTYAAVPDPRIVIATGACVASGGPFRGSSARDARSSPQASD